MFVIYTYLFIFFACPKKTNQKKRHPCPLALRASLKHSILTEIYKLASLNQYIFLYDRIFVFSAK